MRSLAPVDNNQDIITKEYLETEFSIYEVNDTTPPTNTNKIWIKNGVPYYFDSTDNSWNTLRFVTDCNKIVINNGE